MDDAAWTALAMTLTALGGIYTWLAWRRRGVVAGLRGVAITLLAPALWLTDSLRMLTRIVDAVGDWALGLVFSPVVWAGVVLGGLSAVLFVVTGVMSARGVGASTARSSLPEASGPAGSARGEKQGRAQGKGEPAIDDDLAEIEALLRKRGIS